MIILRGWQTIYRLLRSDVVEVLLCSRSSCQQTSDWSSLQGNHDGREHHFHSERCFRFFLSLPCFLLHLCPVLPLLTICVHCFGKRHFFVANLHSLSVCKAFIPNLWCVLIFPPLTVAVKKFHFLLRCKRNHRKPQSYFHNQNQISLS